MSETAAAPPRRSAVQLLMVGAALLGVSIAAACSAMQPDLQRVYRFAPKPRRAVILIPGVFGSRLRDAHTGRLVWGQATSFIKRLYRPWDAEWDLLDLPVDADDPLANSDALEPAGIFDKVAGREYYARVLDTLRDVGGYTPGDIRNPRAGEDLFAFDYDWRRDAPETAARFAEAIDRVLAARGEPGGRVDVVGHSLGGLVARYYLLYGGADVLGSDHPSPTWEGARRVHTLVHMATPNAGTADALRSLVEGTHLARFLPPEAVATMPAAYQLLPSPEEPVVVDSAGDPISTDIFDVATWERFQWSIFSPGALERRSDELRRRLGRKEAEAALRREMEAARRFMDWALRRGRRFIESLQAGAAGADRVRHVAFGGDCLPTPARALVAFDGERHSTWFDPKQIPQALRSPKLETLLTEPGDGTVTRASLQGLLSAGTPAPGMPPLSSAFFLCETHRHITQNIAFHDNLLHVLLEPDR